MILLALCLVSMHSLSALSVEKVSAYSGTTHEALSDELFAVDEKAKKDAVVSLVKKAASVLLKERPERAFNLFSNARDFSIGDAHLWVIDMEGTIYVQGDLHNHIWQNSKDIRNMHNQSFGQILIDKAQQGGGWVQYATEGASQSIFVEKITTKTKPYIIAAGWFNWAKELEVESLLRSAVTYFSKYSKDLAVKAINNPVGQFVRGDLYVYVIDDKGICIAHGNNPSLIGKDFNALKDGNGLIIAKVVTQQAEKDVFGWTEYRWNNAKKRVYVHKLTTTAGSYILVSGYYVDTGRDDVVALVKKAVQYFNSWGKEKAVEQFSQKESDFFIGELNIFLYDTQGNVLAQGDNPKLVGQNIWDLRSAPEGDWFVRDIINTAEKEMGWTSYLWHNSYAVTYAELVSEKDKKYVIGSSFYPDTPRDQVRNVVDSAVSYLKTHSKDAALREFVRPGSPFIRGSIHVFVFTPQGDCLANGSDVGLIWRNFKSFKDDQGKSVFSLFVDHAHRGGGWVAYRSHNTQKIAYVEKVIKDGAEYIIGSAYYL